MTKEFRRGEGHVYRLIAGEHLLVALHSNSPEPLFALTPTAATLWKGLASWTTSEALAALLVDQYEVEGEQAGLDVTEFLGQLESVGAVETRGGQS